MRQKLIHIRSSSLLINLPKLDRLLKLLKTKKQLFRSPFLENKLTKQLQFKKEKTKRN